MERPQPLLSRPVHELPGVHLEPVLSRPDSALWNEYIARYHYLGYTPLPGAQLRYFARWENRLLALLGFGAPAWKTAPSRPLHRLVSFGTGEEPPTDRQQRPFLDPSLGPVPVYVKNVGNGPLAYRAGLPELLPTVGQLATPQGDDGIGAADSPAHPRLL